MMEGRRLRACAGEELELEAGTGEDEWKSWRGGAGAEELEWRSWRAQSWTLQDMVGLG